LGIADDQLTSRLSETLGADTAAALVERLSASGSQPAAVLALLDELEEVSSKVLEAALEALPEFARRAGCSQTVSWLDLGVALAESSGATALKYFKDSPLVLGLVERPDKQAQVLGMGLELAEQDANVSWEFLKAAPQMVMALPQDELPAWLEIGLELSQVNPVVGLEYIRLIPALRPVVPLSDVRGWLSFAMKLITPNAFGKPDYLATMEFLRTSPTILEDVEVALRSRVISLGARLADHAPEAGIAWLAESPTLLRLVPSSAWRTKLLQYGSLLAEQDAEATLSYLRHASALVSLIGDGPNSFTRFEDWFKAGMEVLAYSPEGARAYFATESQKALASVEQALSGVPLRQVARQIKLFVHGLCGFDVSIAGRPESSAAAVTRPTVSPDGKTIVLPALLRRHQTAAENQRLYFVMAAHEAGHLEFGTYRLRMNALMDLVETVRRRYRRPQSDSVESLAALFRLYPHPAIVNDLWTILEDARVEYLLRTEYPGLGRDLAQFAADTILPRDPAHGLTVRELIVDCLLRLSTGELFNSAVPRALSEEVSSLWKLCQPIFTRTCTAETVVRIAHEVYVEMEGFLASTDEERENAAEESSDVGVGPTGSEEGVGAYRAVTNWHYRGEMKPDFIGGAAEQPGEGASEPERMAGRNADSQDDTRTATGGVSERDSPPGELGGGRSLPSIVEELLSLDVDSPPIAQSAEGERTIRYPEWDHTLQDYRLNWCRVLERPADSGSDETVSAALTVHRSRIKSLRRFFESLRPPALRRLPGQADGEDVDVDAVVRRATEQAAGFEGGDRVYIRREKKQRDVAVALLVDVSGSTGRRVESGRRVIDVEKESLVLLCEALEAVGDQYALYAYSGRGRASVEVLTIKSFDERLGTTTAQRLGGLSPREQNRDGAAIRHAVETLKKRAVKTRLLILLNDGRPLDGEYKDEYALEDTKAALREARRQGIQPFCVTIDREADSYVRRMYGDVQYTVIDRVESLPLKLPRIYQRVTT
jgi:nitric oxide reductase NorD protein